MHSAAGGGGSAAGLVAAAIHAAVGAAGWRCQWQLRSVSRGAACGVSVNCCGNEVTDTLQQHQAALQLRLSLSMRSSTRTNSEVQSAAWWHSLTRMTCFCLQAGEGAGRQRRGGAAGSRRGCGAAVLAERAGSRPRQPRQLRVSTSMSLNSHKSWPSSECIGLLVLQAVLSSVLGEVQFLTCDGVRHLVRCWCR